MRLRQSFLFFFLLTLRDGGSALFEKDIGVRTETEGGTITVVCTFSFSGSRKIFCRGDCEDGEILVETSDDSNQRGRYSIEYVEGGLTTFPLIYVSISNLKKSDSGRYSCELGRTLSPDSSETFELRVKNAPTTTTKPNWTTRRFSASTSTIETSTLSSASTNLRTSKTSPQITKGTEQKPATSGQDRLLYLSLLLVLLIIIFSVILLIYCKKRSRKHKAEATGPPVKTEYAEPNQIYEEIREDELNKSPPGDIPTVYTRATFSKPNGVQTTDEYSLAGPQTEDDSSKLAYSVVDFSKSQAAPRNSAPSGGVIYSVPRMDASSEDALYSTVTLH